MSYRFNLIFAKCKSNSDILSAYKSIKNELFKKFKENPELFLYSIPENRGYYTTFLKSIFVFRIYHWKKLNLMALLYDNLSAGFDKNFKSEIYFQNSSDTDYEYKTYQDLSPEIDELINKFKSVKSINDLIALNNDIDEYTIQDISKNPDALLYYTKSRCYDAVYNILDLDVITNDKENKDIDVYAFNAISSIKELYELYNITNAYLKSNIII